MSCPMRGCKIPSSSNRSAYNFSCGQAPNSGSENRLSSPSRRNSRASSSALSAASILSQQLQSSPTHPEIPVSNESRSRQNWADMLDESQSETDIGDADAGDRKSAVNLFSATPNNSEALTSSLLIQSFSGLPSSPEMVHCKSRGSSERLWPCALERTPTLVREGSLMSPDLRRVTVPIQHTEGHRHGYAGLLGLVQHKSGEASLSTKPSIEAVPTSKADVQVHAMLKRAEAGLAAERAPEPAPEGMGGTYFLKGESGNRVCIFKPCDEEPMAPNNPKEWQGRAMGAPGLKPSVRVGEAAIREVAAYLLDHDSFAGVPPACLAECYHPVLNYKVDMPRIETFADLPAADGFEAPEVPEATPPADRIFSRPSGGLARALHRQSLAPTSSTAAKPGTRKLGSLQHYVQHKCDANDMAPSHFFSADNVHRIGIFDIRLLNCDRHAGNLLIQERTSAERVSGASSASGATRLSHGAPYMLIPIDHGYALPEALDNPYFEWLYWPQTSVPFSDEVKEYVANLDAAADIAMLREHLPALRHECLRCLEMTTKVLQMCVAAGLTLFEIGSIFTRNEDERMSDLDRLCVDAHENCTWQPGDDGSVSTTPSTPTSSVSGPLSSALVNLSNNMLPAVHEAEDRDDGDSPPIMFAFSKPGEAVSPTGVVGELSPFTPAMMNLHDDFGGLLTSFDILCKRSTGELSSSASPNTALRRSTGQLSADSNAIKHSPRKQSADVGRSEFGQQPLFVPPHRLEGFEPRHPAAPQSASGLNGGVRPCGQRSLTRARRNAWRTKHGQGKLPAYPPLVPYTHPDQVFYAFTGLDDSQWQDFMQYIEHWVAVELRAGTWKRSTEAVVSNSCPVAFHGRLRYELKTKVSNE